MKLQIVFLFLTVTLLSCGESKSAQKPNEMGRDSSPSYTSTRRMDCNSLSDPFLCLKKACTNAMGTFNDSELTCSCPEGNIFYAVNGGECLKRSENSQNEDLDYVFNGNQHFYVQSFVEGEDTQKIDSIISKFSIPVFPGKSSLLLYNNTEDLKDLPRLTKESDVFMPGFASTELSDYNLNQGVPNQIMRNAAHYFLIPNTKTKVNFKEMGVSNTELLSLVEQYKNSFNLKSTIIDIRIYTQLGCAELCLVKSLVFENSQYRVERVRIFSGGNTIQDNIRFYDLRKNEYVVMLAQFDGRLSHIFISKDNGAIDVYGNDNILFKTIAGSNQTSFDSQADNTRTPVILFEGAYSAMTDKMALTGPFKDQSYYGWFEKNDARPFYYGKSPALLGEEDLGDMFHSHQVSEIASNGFSQGLITLPPIALVNKDIDLVAKRFGKKAVASVSTAYTFSPEVCDKSNLSQSIKASTNQTLWVISAGNSGRRVDKKTFSFCPQHIEAGNLMIVAATSGNDKYLSMASSYGEDYADIAVNGCKFKERSCSVGATSFSAPRFSRAAADLIDSFPALSLLQVKMAIVMTAKVPFAGNWSKRNEFLQTKSGGALDPDAAYIFLKKFSADKSLDLKECSKEKLSRRNCDKLIDAIVEAKKFQYEELDSYDSKKLIKDQIERLLMKY